jgi:YVTN family beta-propeller protein
VTSGVAAIVGSVLLATRDTGESSTTQGITATLQVPSHPGSVAAGENALWLALNRDAQSPVDDRPLLRLNLATGYVERSISVEGQASSITRAGNRLIASVQHFGQAESGGRLLIGLDWLSGRVLVRRGFQGPIDHLVVSDGELWALQAHPGVLLRLDPRTLAPIAPPLRLSPDRTLGLTAGAGYIWVTAADTGELLRIDPATSAITRIDVGGFPMGIAVAAGSIWYADSDDGKVIRLDGQTLQPIGEPIGVGPNPTWLAAAGGTLFATNPEQGTVSRIDVRSGKTVGPSIRVAPPVADGATFAIAPAGNAVWVSSFASNTVTRITSAPAARPQRTVVVTGSELAGEAVALPRGGRVVSTIPVATGGAFAAGEGAVWTMSNIESTLSRIDPQTNSVVSRIKMLGPGEDAAVGEGSVWVSHPIEDVVVRIDPSTNTVAATISVGPQPAGLAVSSGAVWVANIGDPSVSRIDPATNRVVATIRVGPPRACCTEHMSVAAGTDAVWVAVPNLNALVRIDPATNSVTRTVTVPYIPCAFVVLDEDAVWSSTGGCGNVIARVDARTGKLTATLEGDPHPVGLALAFDSLWVAALGVASVDRIDPETARVVSRLPVGGLPVRLAVGFGSVWVSDDEGGRVLRISPDG